MRLIGPDQYRRMPWKNGLGVTTEIARFPADGDRFDWRVSIASVDRDGPFSCFPGIDRILLVLVGDGLLLERADGGQTRLGPLEPCAFSGDDETTGRLVGGPIRDFNVMARRGVVQARLEVCRDETTAVVDAGTATALFHGHSGRVTICSASGEATLAPGATAIVEAPAGVVRLEPATRDTIVLGVFFTDGAAAKP
ncbi:MAG: HutD family protein [Vicinamibacteria bacterium]|nr:HutD family protein [Vicinamibacteria bacterium]